MNNILLCGCGAIGSQLAMHLASPDIHFILIDDDEVGEDNLATSAYHYSQIGLNKSFALANLLWRKAKCSADSHNLTLDLNNYSKFMGNSQLAIDCFDNVDARHITCQLSIPTLHVGVSREGTGSILWDIDYQEFSGAPRGEDIFCTHLAGRAILRLTSSLASHVVDNYLNTSEKLSLIVTEGLRIIK